MTDNDCILWTGVVNNDGYGVKRVGNTTQSAARWAWEQVHGPLSPNLQIDHLCRVPLCVNVEHLEPVTPGENTRRTPRVQVTHCPQGHPLSGDNLYIQIQDGYRKRHCRTCQREHRRTHAQKKRAS